MVTLAMLRPYCDTLLRNQYQINAYSFQLIYWAVFSEYGF